MYRTTWEDKCEVCGEKVGRSRRIGQWGSIIGPLCRKCILYGSAGSAGIDGIRCAHEHCPYVAVVCVDDPDENGYHVGWCARHQDEAVSA